MPNADLADDTRIIGKSGHIVAVVLAILNLHVLTGILPSTTVPNCNLTQLVYPM